MPVNILSNEREVMTFIRSHAIDVSYVWFQNYDNATHMIAAVHGIIKMKQIRDIEKATMTILDKVCHRQDPMDPDSSSTELVFVRV